MLGGERRVQAHRRCRNRAGVLAEASDSDEESLRTGGVSSGGEKRGEGGDRGGFIEANAVEKGLGFRAGETHRTDGSEAVQGEGLPRG
jgi:hypothetical protein